MVWCLHYTELEKYTAASSYHGKTYVEKDITDCQRIVAHYDKILFRCYILINNTVKERLSVRYMVMMFNAVFNKREKKKESPLQMPFTTCFQYENEAADISLTSISISMYTTLFQCVHETTGIPFTIVSI